NWRLRILPFTTVSATTPRRTLMARRDDSLQSRLDRDLAELKLPEIAKNYREVLDEAARKGSSMLEVLATLIGLEQTARQQRALQRRLRAARLPKQKTLAEYDFNFPKRIPKEKILRLFDCDFIQRHGCAVLMGPTRTGKSHLLTALGYTACERGYSLRYTRVVDMLNHLTTAQINGSLGKALKVYGSSGGSVQALKKVDMLAQSKCCVKYSFQIGDTACPPACCTMRSGFGDTSTLGQPSLEEPSTLPSTRGKNRCVARLAARRQYTHVVEPRERFELSPSDANPWSFTSRFRASIASPAV